MHGFVAHQFFQQRRRRVPVDAAQFEEADIEPARQQRFQIRLQRQQAWCPGAEVDQFGAEIDQEFHTIGDGGELRQQLQARRLQRPAQADQRGGAILAVRALAQGRQGGIDGRGIGIEFGQPLKESSPSRRIEGEVALRQLGGPVARRNLAAARGEAGAHLGCDILGLTTDHTLGHVAPQGRDAFQRPVEQSHIRGKVRHS